MGSDCELIVIRSRGVCVCVSVIVALKRLEDLEGAERALEKAHSLAPQDPQVLINYAVVLDAQRKQDRAREMLGVLCDVAALIDVESQVSKVVIYRLFICIHFKRAGDAHKAEIPLTPLLLSTFIYT